MPEIRMDTSDGKTAFGTFVAIVSLVQCNNAKLGKRKAEADLFWKKSRPLANQKTFATPGHGVLRQ
jgi:hypothetical protein